MNKNMILAVLMGALVGVAQAASVTYYSSGASTVGPATAITKGDLSEIASETSINNLPQFNNSVAGPNGDQVGATLTKVTLNIFEGTMHGTYEFNNTQGVADTASIHLAGSTIVFGTGTALTSVDVTKSYSATYAANQITSGQSFTSSGFNNSTDLTGGDMIPFVGSGNVAGMKVSWTGSWGSDFVDSANAFQNVALDGSVKWSVTYEYTPVPEPATMGLLAIGGLVAGLRRRFSKKA